MVKMHYEQYKGEDSVNIDEYYVTRELGLHANSPLPPWSNTSIVKIKIEDIDGEANGGLFENVDVNLDRYKSVGKCSSSWNDLPNSINNNKLIVKLKKVK